MNKRLRVLFVNRMAGLLRGGGETFDLEISRALEKLGCEVHYLTGAPMYGRAPLPVEHPNVHYLHTPYLPWFPWDKVKGGWRVRLLEFQAFERKAVRWVLRHQDRFDVIQVCELPYLVSLLKQNHIKPKVVLRLTAPNVHDVWSGVAHADSVIASGTSIEKIRKSIRVDVVDVPNGVDLERFKVNEGVRCSVFGVQGRQGKESGPRDGILNVQHSTFNIQRSSGGPSDISSLTSIQHSASSIREQHGIPAKAPVLLYVARFQAFKNHKLLIEAFGRVLREVPEARLVLAGSGPLMKEIKTLCGETAGNHSLPRTLNPDLSGVARRAKTEPRLVRRSPEGEDGTLKPHISDRVLFLGETPFDQLPGVYAAADVKVISSEYESFCFAAIEAMACGLPVVTTDCGWVPKLIGDTFEPVEIQWASGGDPTGRYAEDEDGKRIREVPGGMVVHRSDAESLANAMVRMIGDPVLRDTCGRWNREKAEREHGWENSARKLLRLYEEVTTDHAGNAE